MDTLIASSSATFLATTGFSLSSVVDFMAQQIKLIIGAGLGVLQALMPWIIALAVISSLVFPLSRVPVLPALGGMEYAKEKRTVRRAFPNLYDTT